MKNLNKTLLTLAFSAVSLIGLSQPIAEICLVTVDTTSTSNIIVWERSSQISLYPIDSMKIYRLTDAGTDSLIATVDYDDLSEYEDTSASPMLKPYAYKIAAVDSLGVEGPKSPMHKTIHHMVLDNGTGNLHLVWTEYVGVPIDNYVCWRDSNNSSTFQNVNQTPDGNTFAWWDNSTPQQWADLWYKVDVIWSYSCTSTRANHNVTRSNKTQPASGILNIDAPEKSLSHFTLYPNPADGMLWVKFSSSIWEVTTFTIYDGTGRAVENRTIGKLLGQFNDGIDISHLSNGVYTAVVENGQSRIQKRFIVSH